MCGTKVAAVDEVNTAEASGHFLSLTTNDVATEDIKDALLIASLREHPLLCSDEETELQNIFKSVQLGM